MKTKTKRLKLYFCPITNYTFTKVGDFHNPTRIDALRIRQKGDKPTVVKELQERGKAKVIPLLRDEFERQIREQLGL